LVESGALTHLDRSVLHHLAIWPQTTRHGLIDIRSVFVPELRWTTTGTLVALWTYPASPLASLLIVGVCGWVLARRGGVRAAWSVLALWVAANAIELAGKLVIDRPGWRYGLRDSYPSGHTIRACAVAAVLAWTWRRAGAPALLWASTVPLALVLLGDHTPTDVIGGLFVAVFLIALWRGRIRARMWGTTA
jgi:membrane-associated phospholipid phosphatase